MSQSASKLALVLIARDWGTEAERRDGPGSDRYRVILAGLGDKETFRSGAVPLAVAVLFEGILGGDCFVHEERTIHSFHSSVRRLEIGVGDETIAF